MTWPIEHFHYIPAPSSFIEMMPGAPTIVAFPPTGAHGAQVPEPVVGACACAKHFFIDIAPRIRI